MSTVPHNLNLYIENILTLSKCLSKISSCVLCCALISQNSLEIRKSPVDMLCITCLLLFSRLKKLEFAIQR